MTREQRELAELVYWDAASRGGLWWKSALSAADLLCFALLIALPFGAVVKAFCLTITGLFVIPACLCLIRAARTVRNVCAVRDCAAAIEALRNAETPKLRKERIYTPDYAFFFQQSAVLDVRNTESLYVEWVYGPSDRRRGMRERIYRVGAARKTGGYQALFWKRMRQPRPKLPEDVRAVLEELTQHYPALPVDDSGMKH